MIAVTHAVVGGAVARAFSFGNPILAFILGFVSHFIMDRIPHWDYSLRSARKEEGSERLADVEISKDLAWDLLKLVPDFVGGLVLAYIFFGLGEGNAIAVILGALGGVVPDALQFFYLKLRWKPLVLLQKFHMFMHAKKRLNHLPLIGIPAQLAIIFIAWSSIFW